MSNELTIVGNVGETIELHNLPGGGTVCNFSANSKTAPTRPSTPPGAASPSTRTPKL